MSARTPHQWLLAIRDCGVLRVRFDDAVLIDGIEHGWIDAQPVDGDEDALDVRLALPAIQYFQNLPGRVPLSSGQRSAGVAPAPAANLSPDCGGAETSPSVANSPAAFFSPFHEVRNGR